MISVTITNGQSINWSTPDTSTNHVTYLNFGYDFGLTTQIGCAYKLKKEWPLWLQLDFSRPMGGDIFDDFKTRAGMQLKALSYGNFAVITKLHANYRAHQSHFVRMKSWGTEASTALGLYSTKWLVELEAGFDKAIITQLSHSEAYKDNYAGVKDSWYIPAGGNWFYGFKTGRTFGKNLVLSLKIGKTNAQGSDKDALIPAYLEIGMLKPF